MKKKKTDNVIESTIDVYVINERTGQCAVVLSNVDIPQKNDHILIYKDGYGCEMLVTNRYLIVNENTSSIGWNIYTVPIGEPFKVETSDDISDKGKTTDKTLN